METAHKINFEKMFLKIYFRLKHKFIEIFLGFTLKFHLTLIRMAKINTIMGNKYWRGCRERVNLIHS